MVSGEDNINAQEETEDPKGKRKLLLTPPIFFFTNLISPCE